MRAPIRHRGQGLGAICLTKKEPDPEFSREPSAAAIEPAGQGRVGAPGTDEGRRAVVRLGSERRKRHTHRRAKGGHRRVCGGLPLC